MILRQTASPDVQESILKILEQHAIPIASALNERNPIREQDWNDAETDLTLPEVNDERLILDTLLNTASLVGPASLGTAFDR
jgi:hypothetical protein